MANSEDLNIEYVSAVNFGFGLYDCASSFLMITYVSQIRNQMDIKMDNSCLKSVIEYELE